MQERAQLISKQEEEALSMLTLFGFEENPAHAVPIFLKIKFEGPKI